MLILVLLFECIFVGYLGAYLSSYLAGLGCGIHSGVGSVTGLSPLHLLRNQLLQQLPVPCFECMVNISSTLPRLRNPRSDGGDNSSCRCELGGTRPVKHLGCPDVVQSRNVPVRPEGSAGNLRAVEESDVISIAKWDRCCRWLRYRWRCCHRRCRCPCCRGWRLRLRLHIHRLSNHPVYAV